MIGVRLSETEQEVLLALIECPEGNEAMAERLQMTRGGVGWHLTNLYRKTGTRNKVELMRWTLREAYKALVAKAASSAIESGRKRPVYSGRANVGRGR